MTKLNLKERLVRSRRLLLSVVVLLILVALGIWGVPFGLALVQEANARAARETLETLNRALAAYHDKYEGYPDTLERLRGAERGDPARGTPERARLLESALARDRFTQDGYEFRYQPGPADQRWAARVRLFVGYRLTAVPTSDWTGKLYFSTDQSGAVLSEQGALPSPDAVQQEGEEEGNGGE